MEQEYYSAMTTFIWNVVVAGPVELHFLNTAGAKFSTQLNWGVPGEVWLQHPFVSVACQRSGSHPRRVPFR